MKKIKIFIAKILLKLFQEEIINLMADEELKQAKKEAKELGFDDLFEYQKYKDELNYWGLRL